MNIRKLSNALGAEVTGIDLKRIGDRDFDAIRGAWHEHLLLVFRDQQLDYPDYIRFGELDGNLATYLDPEKIAARRKKSPPVAHPVVRVHPDTGRKSLFVSEAVTSHFLGMTRDESVGLLEHLFRLSTRPELTCRHRWRVNDVAIWDNRCTLHNALKDFDHSSPRHMVRMAVLGTPLGRIVGEDAAP